MEIKKAYGVDNIPAELLQALDKEMKYTLYCLINNIYTTGKNSWWLQEKCNNAPKGK